MLHRARANDQRVDERRTRIVEMLCRGEMKKIIPDSSMRNTMKKRLWGLIICLTVTGTSCAHSEYPTVVSGSDLFEPSGYKIGRAIDADGKRPGEGAPDSVWATAEQRQQYKPLVVALAQQDSLLQRPGVVGVRAGYGELQVYTTNPAALPPQLWGVPITAMSPSQCPTCVGGETAPETIPSAVPPIYHVYFR